MAKNPRKELVTLSVVRDWAVAQNLVPSGQRGKLSADVITAFEKANPTQRYDKSANIVKVLVKGRKMTASGKTVPIQRKVTHSEVREAAIAAKVAVPARGRMPQSVLTAYIEDRLPELANA